MEIWLSNGTHDKIKLPVNPQSIGYNDTRNFEDIILANGDEKTVVGGRNLRTYSISSFFPRTRPYYAQVKNMKTPREYVNKIKSWMDAKKVLLLQVTGTNINDLVTIRSFEWEEKGGAVGDIEYTLELKEYEPVSYSRILSNNNNNSKNKKRNNKKSRPPSTKPKPKTYTVKKGDTLWKIAKKLLGDGSLWVKIYEKNKKTIGSNPDSLKHGQRLVVP